MCGSKPAWLPSVPCDTNRLGSRPPLCLPAHLSHLIHTNAKCARASLLSYYSCGQGGNRTVVVYPPRGRIMRLPTLVKYVLPLAVVWCVARAAPDEVSIALSKIPVTGPLPGDFVSFSIEVEDAMNVFTYPPGGPARPSWTNLMNLLKVSRFSACRLALLSYSHVVCLSDIIFTFYAIPVPSL